MSARGRSGSAFVAERTCCRVSDMIATGCHWLRCGFQRGQTGVERRKRVFGALAADERETFATGRRCQPAAELFWVADGSGVFERAQPSVLYGVGGVGRVEVVARDHGADEAPVPGKELVPG